MEIAKTANKDYYPEILKTVQKGERVYFTGNDEEDYVLIPRKELEALEKSVVFTKLIDELNQIRENNNKNNSWVPEEEADRILGWDKE